MEIVILQVFDFNPGQSRHELAELLQNARLAVQTGEAERAVFTGRISDAQSFTFSHMERAQKPDSPHASGPWYGRASFGQKGPGAKILKTVRTFWQYEQRKHQSMQAWLALADRTASAQCLALEAWQEMRAKYLVSLPPDILRSRYGGLLGGLDTREIDDTRQHGDNVRTLLRTIDTLQRVCTASLEQRALEGV